MQTHQPRLPPRSLPPALVLAAPALAQAPASAPVSTSSANGRLTHGIKLWGTLRHLHPSLAHKDIHLDAALVQAVPKVRAAATAEQYSASVQGMLDALADPATRVRKASPEY